MFAAGRRKVHHLDKAPCLYINTPHQLREGKAAFVATLPRKAPEIADRLKMDAPHGGGQLQGLPYYGSDGVGVHSTHEGGNEDNAKTSLAGIPDGLEFLVQERSSP